VRGELGGVNLLGDFQTFEAEAGLIFWGKEWGGEVFRRKGEGQGGKRGTRGGAKTGMFRIIYSKKQSSGGLVEGGVRS